MIQESLKPCTYVFKIFGTYCLDINHPRKTNTVGVAWSLTVVFYCIGHALYGIYERDVHFSSLLLTLTDTMQIYVSLTNSAICVISLVLMRKKLIFFLETLNKFDVSNDISEDKNKKTCMIALALSVAALIIIYISFDISLYLTEFSFESIGDVVAYCFPFSVAVLLVTQFCVMVLLLKRRFRWINEKLTQIQRQINKKPATITDRLNCERVIKFLENLRHQHDRLCRLSVTVNKVYSLPVLTTILQNFTVIIVTLFSHLENSKPLRRDYSVTIYNIYDGIVILCNCAEAVLMVKACSTTRDEAKRTATILHKFHKTSQDVNSFIEFFSMQLMHSSVEFTACEIFVVDETLLFSMVGAISTYLIIVLQLQMDT